MENEQLIQFLETKLKVYTNRTNSNNSLNDDSMNADRSQHGQDKVSLSMSEVERLKNQIKELT